MPRARGHRRAARCRPVQDPRPEELGGPELTIPESVRVFERVASFDASTAWTLAILADGPLFARFLSDEAFETICGDPAGLICGTLNPTTAQAEPVDGGFIFSGTAGYLSGSGHAKWVMASALVTKDGQPDASDGIEIRSGLFPIEQARSLDTWHVTGMRATGSSDHAFEGVVVAESWTFEPFRPDAGRARRARRDPAVGAARRWRSPPARSGAARNMIDRFVELAATKVPAGRQLLPPRGTGAGADRGRSRPRASTKPPVRSSTTAPTGVGEGSPVGRSTTRHSPSSALATVTAVRLAAQAIDCAPRRGGHERGRSPTRSSSAAGATSTR